MATKQKHIVAERKVSACEKTAGKPAVVQGEHPCSFSSNPGDDSPRIASKVDREKNVISSSPRLGNCVRNFVADNKENLKKIKESKNRFHEVEKYFISHRKREIIQEVLAQETERDIMEVDFIQSKASQVSPKHITNTTSSQCKTVSPKHITNTTSSQCKMVSPKPQHITNATSGQCKTSHVSPKHITTTMSSPGKLRHQLGSRLSASLPVCSSLPPSTVCQSLKSNLIHTLQAASDTLCGRKKIKTVNLANRSSSLSSQEPVNNNIQNTTLKLCVKKFDQQSISLCTKSATSNKMQCGISSDRRITAGFPKNKHDKEQTVDPTFTSKKIPSVVPVKIIQSSVGNTKTTPMSKNCKIKQYLSDSSSVPKSVTSVSDGQKLEEEFSTDLTTISHDSEMASDDTITDTRNTSNKVSYSATLNNKTHQSVNELLAPVSVDECSQTILKSTEVLNNQKMMCTPTPSLDQTFCSSSNMDSSAISPFSAIMADMDCARFSQEDVLNEDKLGNNLHNFTSKELSSKEKVHKHVTEKSNSPVIEVANIQLDPEKAKCHHSPILNSERHNQYLGSENLWSLVDSKEDEVDSKKNKVDLDDDCKEDCIDRETEIIRLKTMNLLDSILDKTELNLESLAFLIAQQGDEDYSQANFALNATQHHRPARDVDIAEQNENKEDPYNEKLERALRESDQMLSELSLLTGH